MLTTATHRQFMPSTQATSGRLKTPDVRARLAHQERSLLGFDRLRRFEKKVEELKNQNPGYPKDCQELDCQDAWAAWKRLAPKQKFEVAKRTDLPSTLATQISIEREFQGMLHRANDPLTASTLLILRHYLKKQIPLPDKVAFWLLKQMFAIDRPWQIHSVGTHLTALVKRSADDQALLATLARISPSMTPSNAEFLRTAILHTEHPPFRALIQTIPQLQGYRGYQSIFDLRNILERAQQCEIPLERATAFGEAVRLLAEQPNTVIMYELEKIATAELRNALHLAEGKPPEEAPPRPDAIMSELRFVQVWQEHMKAAGR